MKVLAVYPGRFQPFHEGHAQVYNWLKEKFGDAVIATSDKVEAPKSPFNFSEKKKMMMLAGVPSDDIHQVANPYISKEILKEYDPKKTVLVFAVSQKDMDEDPRFSFKPTKSGKPSYLQPYAGNEKKLKPFGDVDKPIGYVVVTPTFTFDVLGKPATSASELRKQFVSLNNEKQKDFIKDLFGKYSAPIHKLMDTKIRAMITKPKTLKEMRGANIGMTLSRSLMPQLGASSSFVEYLKTNDIQSQKLSIDPDSLKSSQMEFDQNKIDSMRNQKSDNPIVVSNDDYVLDGHHRWLADKMEQRNCDAYRVDLPILELMRIAKEYENKQKGILNEAISRKELGPKLDAFVSFASNKLGIKTAPKVRYKTEEDGYNSFAAYNPSLNELSVVTKDRHPMDIFRSVAHELVHHKQNEDGRIKDVAKEGATGSPIENEANAEAGRIMRWYANVNPKEFDLSFVAEETLTEGIYDQNIFKAVFLAGGPGSGKDFIMKKTITSDPRLGLVEINSDNAFEYLMKKEGLNPKMPPEEESKRNLVRGRAKNITREKERLAIAGRLGIIINGTADDFSKIETIKKQLELLGYETMMLFVNTSDDTSRERNLARPREVPEAIRQEKWRFAQENIGHFQKLFGTSRFIVVDNSKDANLSGPFEKKMINDNLIRVSKIIKSFVNTRPTNANALSWIEKQKTKRGITEMAKIKEAEQEVAMSKTSKKDQQHLSAVKKPQPKVNINTQFESYIEDPNNRELGTPSLTKIYADMTPGQSVPAPDAPIMEKKKLVFKKKVAQEERNPLPTLPNSDGIGPEITQYRPFTVTGFTYGLSESIEAWANNPKTQKKFFEKYGDLAEAKLIDAAKKLQETGCGTNMTKPKSMKEMRELAGMKQGISGNVYKDGDMDEESEDVVKPTGTVKGYKKLIHPQSDFEKKATKSLEEETPAWQRKEGKNPEGGLNRKGVMSYRRANPGSKLQTAVTTEPSKLKKGSKSAKRRLSFCRRMKGMKAKLTSAKTARDPDSRINKSLRKWNCEE